VPLTKVKLVPDPSAVKVLISVNDLAAPGTAEMFAMLLLFISYN
jgi:hypothetical protein